MTRAIQELIGGLSDPDEAVRRYAAEDIAEQWDPAAIPALVKALGDASPAVRESVIDALTAGPCEATVRALLPVLESDDPATRNAACEAIRSIGQPAVEPLAGLTLTADRDVKLFALDLLALIGGTGAEEAISNVLPDPDPNIGAAAASALAKVGGECAAHRLVAALGGDPWVRCAATIGLGAIGGPAALAALTGLVQDADEQVCFVAVRALKECGGPESVTPLIGALRHANPVIAEMALDALDDVSDRMVHNGARMIAHIEAPGILQTGIPGMNSEARSQIERILGRFEFMRCDVPEISTGRIDPAFIGQRGGS